MTKLRVSAAALLLLTSPLFADNDESDSAIPDIELLEFLGSWQTPDGDFLDPLILAGDTTTPEQPTEHDDD
jgi:hypothetical protein